MADFERADLAVVHVAGVLEELGNLALQLGRGMQCALAGPFRAELHVSNRDRPGIEDDVAFADLHVFEAAEAQRLHGGEKSVERKLANRFVEGGETELAFVGTTSRGFDVNDAMREVVVGVEIVRQSERGEVSKRRAGRRSWRRSKRMSRSMRRKGR